ncbi:tetratricopeptide repeat protein, partial [Siphonobacter sp. BAB-5385]|uniref:tetratricopeptide repeat protein n=1 Tax=Siphonobacter sp. BAB-5385 TaxID=1864822 RepID=UPI001C3CBD78
MKTSEHKTGNWFVDQLNLYQSANSDSQSLKNNFVIRQGEFRLIIEDLRNKGPQDPLQHELLLGRRGSGKSTLLKRIQIEIDEVLTDQYLAVNLAEEQAGIYRLFDLWEEVLRELSVKWKVTLDLQSFESFDDNQSYTRYLYAEIHQLVQAKQKRIVLLLDNLDRILENFGGEGHLLREILLNDNDLVIIGGSTRMDEQFWKYDQPFYEFFRRHRLEALSSEEIHRLLHHWSEQMELPQLWEFSQKYPGKIETIRLLTDGLPRTLQFFIQILLKDSTLYGFDYLRKVMDNVTPLYQERLNHLPPAHRKIVQEMAFLWEACSVKQLVEKCRMESKLISAHLKQLSNAGIIEVIATSKKNNLYRLSERFFNMWLMITQGNPEQKRRAKWLTLFLEAWYDENQWAGLVEEHLQRLSNNELPYDRAIVLTKALAQSKHIGTRERDQMIDLTAALQANPIKNDLLGMPEKFVEIAKTISILIQEKKYQQAHQLVDSIENEKDGVKFFVKSFLYDEQGKLEEAEQYYLKAIAKGHINALNNLANLYSEQGKMEEAEQYYLQA